MVKKSLFCNQSPEHFYQIPYDQDTATAASNYQKRLEENNVTPFDLVLLSLGEDGHIASLFPGQTYNTHSLVIPVDDAPKDPTSRISLTASALSNCSHMILLATGTEKRGCISSHSGQSDA